MSLKGTKTEQNLKDAFSGESQANRRYLYFAQKADVEGYNDVAAVFRSTAEGETGHAHGHLQFLEEVGDPATGEPMGDTPVKRTNIPTCIRVWRGPLGMKASTRSPIGSRPLPRPRRAMPGASRRRWRRSTNVRLPAGVEKTPANPPSSPAWLAPLARSARLTSGCPLPVLTIE